MLGQAQQNGKIANDVNRSPPRLSEGRIFQQPANLTRARDQ